MVTGHYPVTCAGPAGLDKFRVHQYNYPKEGVVEKRQSVPENGD